MSKQIIVLSIALLLVPAPFLGCGSNGTDRPTAPFLSNGEYDQGEIIQDPGRSEGPHQGVDFVHGRDREVLLVDDSRDTVFPRDWEQDAFWQELFANYGLGEDQVDVFASFGDLDVETVTPMVPALEELNRYRAVVWYTHGAGFNGRTALLEVAARHPVLADYVKMGGKLWISGQLTLAATILAEGGRFGDFVYPKSLEPGLFAWDVLRLKSHLVDNDKGLSAAHTLARVSPVAGEPEIYPEMALDETKLHPIQALWGGITHADAVLGPIATDPGHRIRLDRIYQYGAVGPLEQGRPSVFHEAVTGVRWSYAGRGPVHGKVQWFGFPLYYFHDDAAQETFNRTMDWLLEKPRTPSPGSR